MRVIAGARRAVMRPGSGGMSGWRELGDRVREVDAGGRQDRDGSGVQAGFVIRRDAIPAMLGCAVDDQLVNE